MGVRWSVEIDKLQLPERARNLLIGEGYGSCALVVYVVQGMYVRIRRALEQQQQ